MNRRQAIKYVFATAAGAAVAAAVSERVDAAPPATKAGPSNGTFSYSDSFVQTERAGRHTHRIFPDIADYEEGEYDHAFLGPVSMERQVAMLQLTPQTSISTATGTWEANETPRIQLNPSMRNVRVEEDHGSGTWYYPVYPAVEDGLTLTFASSPMRRQYRMTWESVMPGHDHTLGTPNERWHEIEFIGKESGSD